MKSDISEIVEMTTDPIVQLKKEVLWYVSETERLIKEGIDPIVADLIDQIRIVLDTCLKVVNLDAFRRSKLRNQLVPISCALYYIRNNRISAENLDSERSIIEDVSAKVWFLIGDQNSAGNHEGYRQKSPSVT